MHIIITSIINIFTDFLTTLFLIRLLTIDISRAFLNFQAIFYHLLFRMANKRQSLKGTRNGGGTTKTKSKRPTGGVQKKTKSNHSMNPDRKISNAGPGTQMRTKATINRLRMYKNFKPIR